MNPQHTRLLKDFIVNVDKNPDLLNLPELGANIPRKSESPVDSGAEETSESDIEFDDDVEVLPEEEVVDMEVGDESVEVTEDMIESAANKCHEAQSILSEKNYEGAIKAFTEAIKLNPSSALCYARRANCYLKLNKPSHAIRDCDKAVSLNPDSATAFKWRGFANKLLGHWEQAYNDLLVANGLDYSDETSQAIKELEPKAKRIYEHNRKRERKREEKLMEERRERVRRAQEEQKNAPKDNIPSFEGMDAFSQLFNDPELTAAMKDPEVMQAFTEVCSNPSGMDKYKDNPKVQKIIEKMTKKFPFGAGGMSGMSGGMPDQSCPGN